MMRYFQRMQIKNPEQATTLYAVCQKLESGGENTLRNSNLNRMNIVKVFLPFQKH